MRRNWSRTNLTAQAARGCQVCGRQLPLQRAHIIGRARDGGDPGPHDVAMLCWGCHGAYDRHDLDIDPHLTSAQAAAAVAAAGGRGQALRRLMGSAWRTTPGESIDTRLEVLRALEEPRSGQQA
jgi:hypothetical protein